LDEVLGSHELRDDMTRLTIMRREIDILVKAVAKNCALVEKASRAVWTPEQLKEAEDAGCFREHSDLLPPDRHMEAVGPLPGEGLTPYRPVGQTRHFVILVALEPDPAAGPQPPT
jgi:hypothetical protein